MPKFDSIMVNVDVGTSRKFARFSPAERWCIVAGVWALAGKSPFRGYLLLTEHVPLTDADVAEQAGVGVGTVRSTLQKMRALGMLEKDESLGAEHVHDWHEHQPEPKSSDSREAWRERQRAKRERDQARDVTRDVTPSVTRDIRDSHADVTPNCHAPEEKRSKETPLTPQGEKPTFARKPIPKTTLERARVILASFNLQAGTDFEEVTGRGRLTDAMSRIVGALTDYPNLTVEEADRMIRWQLDHPFWDGKPHPGVVFGPKVIEKARAAAGEHRDTPADFVARLNARTQPGGDAA